MNCLEAIMTLLTPRDEIISRYSSLAQGTSLAGEMCPKCGGGGTKEKSLSVSKTGGGFSRLLWKCHRNSCKFKGRHTYINAPSDGTTTVGINIPRTPSSPKIVFDRFPLNSVGKAGLAYRHYITEEEISRSGLEWTNYRTDTPPSMHQAFGRIVIPLRNRDFSIAGYNLRMLNSLTALDLPKAIIVKEKDHMGIIWFNCYTGPSGKVIIVEDCYSAIRASKYLNAVALLGTHLSKEQVMELKSFNMRRHIIALDNDAHSTMVEHIVNYKDILPNFTGFDLNADLKDLPPWALDQVMEKILKE